MAAKKSAKKNAAKKSSARKPAPAKKPAAKKRAKRVAAKGTSRTNARAAAPAVMHWEIQAKDAKKMQAFYAKLFGWNINVSNPMNYGMVSSKGEGGIDGGIGGTPNEQSRVLVYANVADINGFIEKAESLGAKTIMPRTDLGMVVIGIFEDLEGNHFGVIEGLPSVRWTFVNLDPSY